MLLLFIARTKNEFYSTVMRIQLNRSFSSPGQYLLIKRKKDIFVFFVNWKCLLPGNDVAFSFD